MSPTPGTQQEALSSDERIDQICTPFEVACKAALVGGPWPLIEDALAAYAGSEREDLLRELVFLDVLYRRRDGQNPQASEYQARFPELGAAWLVRAIARPSAPPERPPHSTQAALPLCGTPDDRKPSARAGTIPRRLGDYRIVREVGRGGMGVVYEAIQESLGRHVALKVLPFNSLLGPTHLERFQREARSAAKLHHTNIVPVYGVGEHEGVHYYAMQYIEGRGLDLVVGEVKRLRRAQGTPSPAGPHDLAADVAASLVSGRFSDKPPKEEGPSQQAVTRIALGPTRPPHENVAHTDDTPATAVAGTELGSRSETEYFRGMARIGLQVAEALEYAHRQGVLHRDIKPSNLLLDTAGTVWVTDFGLAKADDTADLTSPGDVVGTLRYMAPERFEGRSDPRSDVYGLGVTLYELLTLRPALDDSDRARLIERARRETPPLPRKLDRRIPRDLETIVSKAIAKEPEGRYATAGDMAEDLRRFLADRPIRARRTPLSERAWRWCRRNPALAMLTGAVAALLVFAALGSTVAALWLQAAGRETTEKLCESLLAQARAGRTSRRVGQRFESLRVVEEAVKIARKLKLPEQRFLEMRNEVIACLALPDVRVAAEWEGWPAGTLRVVFDGTLERYARLHKQGNVSIRRVADDEEIYHLSGLGGARDLHWSPDGRFLAVRGIDWIKLWKLTGTEPSLMVKEQSQGFWADFSPDSRMLAVAHKDGSVVLYDPASGLQLRPLQAGAEPRHLAFHPTERQLAIACYDRVEVRNLDTGNKLAQFPLEGDVYSWVCWHPHGKVLAMQGGDRIIYLWDMTTGKQTAKLEGSKSWGIRFTFNHAGDLLASICWDGVLRLWDPYSGKELFHTQAPNCDLRFSGDDRFLAFGGALIGSKLRIWEVNPGREYRTLARGHPFNHAVSSNGRLLAVGMFDGFGLWDLASGQELRIIPLTIRTWVVGFEPLGALLTDGRNGLWRWPIRADATSPNRLQIGPPELIPLPGFGSAISSDGRVIASPRYWGALVLHTDRPGRPVTLAPQSDVRQVAVSPDGRWVATNSFSGTSVFKVWDAETGKPVKELFAGEGQRVAFSPDGRWLAASGDAVRVWEVGSWIEQHRFEGPKGTLLAFSPDGNMLAYETGEGVVRLVEPETGQEWARLVDPDQKRANWISFTPDGAQLVMTTDDGPSVHAWDLRAIRRELAARGLDWDLPPYQTANEGDPLPRELRLERGRTFGLLTAGDPACIGLNSFLLDLNPFNGEAYWQRGRAYGMEGEYEKAIADYGVALALLAPHDPRCAEILFRRASNYYRLGDHARTLTDLQQLLSMDLGDFSGMHADLAWMCNQIAWQLVTRPEKERDPVRALPLAQKAITLTTPELSPHRITLGVVYCRLGQYRQAIEVLEQSLRESADETVAYALFFLSQCHARLDAAAKAQEYYDHAVAWVHEHQGKLHPDKQADLDACQAEARALLGKGPGS